MNQVIFLVLRRMRTPLVMLICAYAISILGLVIIPGSNASGEPWHMGFFHAFYFVSYMATTIGFGELPYQFSEAQRLWTVVAIYLTVVTWIYALGKILSLMQEPSFRQVVTEQAFMRSVRRLNLPYYIICGYGDTGKILLQAMDQRGVRSVAIDIDATRINELETSELQLYVPGLCADARRVDVLKEAGLMREHCSGVVALTNDDEVNLKIAIISKLLRPDLHVICRSESKDAEVNMASFGTDKIFNPFETFADRLALALNSPGVHLLHEVLTSIPGHPLPKPIFPPHGFWVVCGYGRFGKAVRENLMKAGVQTVVIEAEPELTGCAEWVDVVGRGTEAETLLQANIEGAAGIVAGTDNDTNNLSIIMTAHDINPGLFRVARQNLHDNDEIFQVANLDLVMQGSWSIAQAVFALITTPLLTDFLQQTRTRDNDWANQLVSRILGVCGDTVPELWVVDIAADSSPAVYQAKDDKLLVKLGHLFVDPRDREASLDCLPLIIERDGEHIIAPDGEELVERGDQILFCGTTEACGRMEWTRQNRNTIYYVLQGEERPDSYIWQRLLRSNKG